MGSIGFKLHCTQFSHMSDQMNRKLTDIDFASYSSETNSVDHLLRSVDYTTQSYVQLAAANMRRSIYWKKDRSVHLDVFWDRLQMNHTVNFRGRLETDKPTLPLPELMQEKFQIVKMNWKDIKDVVMLLREHDVAEKDSGRELVDLSIITNALSNDWGYYHTFTQNIKETQTRIRELAMLSENDRAIVSARLAKMLRTIEDAPKSAKWILRSKIGTKHIWYTEVGEV